MMNGGMGSMMGWMMGIGVVGWVRSDASATSSLRRSAPQPR